MLEMACTKSWLGMYYSHYEWTYMTTTRRPKQERKVF